MKKILSVFVLFIAGALLFARSPRPLESVELSFIYDLEIQIESQFDSNYKIVKIHPSEKGQKNLQEDFIRDIIITDKDDNEVCTIYPYYKNQNPSETDAKLPVEITLNNKNKFFKNTSDETVVLCFNIQTDDKNLLRLIIEAAKDEAFIKLAYRNILTEINSNEDIVGIVVTE